MAYRDNQVFLSLSTIPPTSLPSFLQAYIALDQKSLQINLIFSQIRFI